MRKKQKNVTEEQNTKSMRKDDVAVNKKDETTDGYKSELNTIFKASRKSPAAPVPYIRRCAACRTKRKT